MKLLVFSKALDGKVILVIELGPELVEPCGSSRKTLVEKPLRRSRKYTSCGEKLIIVCITHIFYFLFILILFFRSTNFDRHIALRESGGNGRLVVLGLKVMDRLALDDVKPKYSGKAQVA